MMGYGYENAAGDRISALIDMINGGGPGRSGGTFEGGGILSLLANAVAKPYGSVRERPGHTPVGAAAPMEVLRPVARPVATGASVAPVETTALPESRSVERSFETEGAAPRYLTEDEAARLANLPESIAQPDLLSLFNSIPVGAPLSPQEGMILDALLASASYNPAVQDRRGLNRVSTTAAPLVSPWPKPRPAAEPAGIPAALPAAETAAPLVSPRPKLRPAAEPAAGSAGTDAPTLVTDEDGFNYYVYPGGKMIYGDNALFYGLGDEISPGSTRYNRIMAQMALRALAGTDAPTRVTDEYGKPYYLSPGGKMTYGEGHIFSDPGDEVSPSSDLYNEIMTRIALEGLAR